MALLPPARGRNVSMDDAVQVISNNRGGDTRAETAPVSQRSSSKKHHILLMERQPHIRQSLTVLLKDLFVIHAADNATAALGILQAHNVAVLVADESVTNCGNEFLAEMGQLSPATRVLLTGYDQVETVVRAVDRGQIYAYVAKPWSPMELRLTLTQAAAHYDLFRKLQLEQLLLRQLLEHSPDVIYFKDQDRRFTRVNQAKAELVGIADPSKLIGRGDWDFFSPEEASRITEEDDRVIAEQKPVVDELHQFTPPDGRMRWFSTTKVPLDPEVGGGLVGISRDITDRKLAEERLQTVSAQLVEAEKDKKVFYTQVVRAVTGGKLNLVDPEEIPSLGTPDLELSLDQPENYALLRDQLREMARGAGFSEEQTEDLILATGEAVTNAIKHAMNGVFQATLSEEGITVRVQDQGHGIRSEDLPETLFQAGFSTKISLGLGYTLLLQLVDGIWLATGVNGTTLQLFKQKNGHDAEQEALLALLDRF
jgi:PAS domain S-box-containing protein